MTDILKQLRLSAGLTQEKLSEEINVAPTTVQNWEKEDKIPPDMFRLLSNYYRLCSEAKNNLAVALYGDNPFESLNEILGNDKQELHILILDSGCKWRSLLKYISPEKIAFHSLSDSGLAPVYVNPLRIPYGVNPQAWVENLVKVFSDCYKLDQIEKQVFSELLYNNYTRYKVFPPKGISFTAKEKESVEDWKAEISERSAYNTFVKIWKDCQYRIENEQHYTNNSFGSSKEALCKIRDLLNSIVRPYSCEYQMFSCQKEFANPNSIGIGEDCASLLDRKEITVLESGNTDSQFVYFIQNFILSVFQKGFYHDDKKLILVSDIDGKVEVTTSSLDKISDKKLERMLETKK